MAVGEVLDGAGRLIIRCDDMSAPTFVARSSASCRLSTAITLAAVVAFTSWTAMWPRPPTPTTTTVDVGAISTTTAGSRGTA